MSNKENNEPRLSVEAQYLKDLSFENPNAPASIVNAKNPSIDLSIDVKIQKMPEDDVYEVALHVEATASEKDKKIFIVEVVYAGVFSVVGFDDEHKNLALGIHCPAILFPYARKIVGDMTQTGGFLPLMIDPIDFASLYYSKMGAQQENLN